MQLNTSPYLLASSWSSILQLTRELHRNCFKMPRQGSSSGNLQLCVVISPAPSVNRDASVSSPTCLYVQFGICEPTNKSFCYATSCSLAQATEGTCCRDADLMM